MIVKVHMLAFEEEYKVREVTLPDSIPHTLDYVYHYGQNDFAVGPEKNTTCSVSVADVIELDGKLHLVASCGFKEITIQRFAELLLMDRRERQFCDLVRG